MDKAKAYDEALERARKQRDDYQKELDKTDKNSQLANILRAGISAVEMIFPQFKESDDERIRKAIIKSIEEDSSVYEQEVSKEQMLAYLEKQKEQKSVSAEELLVKAGLKHYKDGNMWCIFVGDNIQEGICGFGNTIDEALYQFLMEVLEIQKKPHYSPLCNTIKDKIREYIANHFIADTVVKTDMRSIVKAMEEGVRLGEEKQQEQKPSVIEKLREISTPADENWFEIQKQWEKEDEQKPDTRDADDLQLLDFIYDLLNEIEWRDNWAMSKDECLRRLNNYRPQKPAEWSEDFEQNIRNLLHDKLMWHSDDGSISTAVFIDDKTLKDIVTGIWFYVGKEAMKNPNMELPKQKWSEEDKKRVKQLIYDTEHIRAEYEKRKKELGESFNDELIKDCDEQIAWLKDIFLNHKKFTEAVEKLWSNDWSEDDETCIRNLESIIYYDKKLSNDTRVILGEFLNNLRKRLWKPSEEQIEALERTIHLSNFGKEENRRRFLLSLLKELKKLGVKEEPEYYQHFDPDC